MKNATKTFTLFLLSFLFFQGRIQSQGTCATAVMLNTGPTCTPTSGTLVGANATTLAATCSANPNTSADVWYRFVAESTFPTVTLSNVGAQFAAAGPRIQIRSACTGGTIFDCSNTLTATPSSALTLGTTYYIRILTNSNTGTPAGTWTFDICVTNPPVVASRMNEVFKETTLHGSIDANITDGTYPAGNLNNPWEILYGPDGNLWITEARGYVIRRMNPNTGASDTMVYLANGASGWLTPAEHTTYNRVFTSGQTPWPQGGMMGLAVHPDFMHPTTPKKFVYVGYVHRYDSVSVITSGGHFFTTKIVRFEYNTGTNKLYNPISICDTLMGSDDHNSGRMIIAPVGGVNYLFYALGDMGTGNYNDKARINRSQDTTFYEGKVLRFNLEPDSDPGLFDRWIPDSTGVHDNPFNGVKQNAVYTTGVRNNQGFAYNPETNKLYGAEHGQFADDEINIIDLGKNYGHPLVEGYADGNYNGAKPGSSSGSYTVIASEAANAGAIGSNFTPPLYTFFPAPNSGPSTSILSIYGSTTGDPGGNNAWLSVAHSGMDIYTSSFIPGWKNSLLTAAMKKAKFFRMKLNASGDTVVSTPPGSASPLNDTVGVFWSQNRYRDLAISPNGKTIFAAIDRNSTTSGPTTGSPQGSLCPGCIKKFEFLGYADNAGVSTIPTSIPVGTGISDSVTAITKTVINSDNNNIWVPITDNNGDIIAEIDANGNSLDTITSSVYINIGAIRSTPSGKPYLDRSITITPKNQPTSPVNIRLYLKTSELANLIGAPGSSVSSINDVKIFKNNDANSSVLTNTTTLVVPATRGNFGSDFVITASIDTFSSFYFAANLSTLPLDLLTFTGHLQNNNSVLLNWKTENEINTSYFLVERSIDGTRFNSIRNVSALGGRNNQGVSFNYSITDEDAVNQSSLKLYYRLKMVDIDGSFKYSNIVFVSIPYITNKVTISPNPVINEVKVTITSPENGRVQWKLMDNVGRVILKGTEHVKKGGGNNFTINMNKVSAGAYYLGIKGAGNDQQVKMQKL